MSNNNASPKTSESSAETSLSDGIVQTSDDGFKSTPSLEAELKGFSTPSSSHIRKFMKDVSPNQRLIIPLSPFSSASSASPSPSSTSEYSSRSGDYSGSLVGISSELDPILEEEGVSLSPLVQRKAASVQAPSPTVSDTSPDQCPPSKRRVVSMPAILPRHRHPSTPPSTSLLEEEEEEEDNSQVYSTEQIDILVALHSPSATKTGFNPTAPAFDPSSLKSQPMLSMETPSDTPGAGVRFSPIPALIGPNNLPYARCPSGIDALLFDETDLLTQDGLTDKELARPIVEDLDPPLPHPVKSTAASLVAPSGGHTAYASARAKNRSALIIAAEETRARLLEAQELRKETERVLAEQQRQQQQQQQQQQQREQQQRRRQKQQQQQQQLGRQVAKEQDDGGGSAFFQSASAALKNTRRTVSQPAQSHQPHQIRDFARQHQQYQQQLQSAFPGGLQSLDPLLLNWYTALMPHLIGLTAPKSVPWTETTKVTATASESQSQDPAIVACGKTHDPIANVRPPPNVRQTLQAKPGAQAKSASQSQSHNWKGKARGNNKKQTKS